MKKVTTIIIGILFAATAAVAGTPDKHSSWEEILSNDSIKAVFPSISVGNGKYVTYDRLFLDKDKLTTGTTYEDPVETIHTTASRERGRDPLVIRTVTKKTEAPLNYTTIQCTEFWLRENGEDREPLVCNPVAAKHSLTVKVAVYKKAPVVNSRENANIKDIFLFNKEYTVPVYKVK